LTRAANTIIQSTSKSSKRRNHPANNNFKTSRPVQAGRLFFQQKRSRAGSISINLLFASIFREAVLPIYEREGTVNR
jgi:hypothetical protein